MLAPTLVGTASWLPCWAAGEIIMLCIVHNGLRVVPTVQRVLGCQTRLCVFWLVQHHGCHAGRQVRELQTVLWIFVLGCV